MMKRKQRLFLLAVTIPVILLCTNDYNPFEDYSTAQIHIDNDQSTIKDGDAVNIFSTKTLAVYTTNRQKISEFTVSVTNNRFWKDTTIRLPEQPLVYRFPVSFTDADTGLKKIFITAKRTNNEPQNLIITLYIRSPLKQDTIRGTLGSTCQLSSPAVEDADVYYHWNFGLYNGKDTSYKFTTNSNSAIITSVQPGKLKQGKMWVTDRSERFPSVPTVFSYLFEDTVGPEISCLSLGVRGHQKDSIVTGEDSLNFAVLVKDQTDGNVGSVELVDKDGTKLVWTSEGQDVYKNVFVDMKTTDSSKTKTVTVNASDAQGVKSSKTFYLYYDASGPKSNRVKIVVLSPQSSTSQDSILKLSLRVESDNGDPMNVNVAVVVNGQAIPSIRNIVGLGDTCSWDVLLRSGQNAIIVYAKGSPLLSADTTLNVTYTPKSSDTTLFEVTNIGNAMLKAGRDTFKVTLKFNSKNPPYHSAMWLDSITPSQVTLLDDSISNGDLVQLRWAPLITDSGTHSVILSAIDSTKILKTAFPFFIIIEKADIIGPSNPCTLSLKKPLLGSDKKLDLTRSVLPETLSFAVKDPDNRASDSINIKVKIGPKIDTTFWLDATNKFNVILTREKYPRGFRDTLTVFIEDRTHNRDFLSIPIVRFWSAGVKINTTIVATDMTAAIFGFPLLVRLHKDNFAFIHSTGDGRDIRFYKKDNTPLFYEIERWDSTAQKAEIWVRMDTIFANNSNQAFLMSWGDTSLKDGQSASTVFDPNQGFVGVWHLSDNNSSLRKNSVQNEYNGKPLALNSKTAKSKPTVDGLIGKSDDFSNDIYLDVGNPKLSNEITVSAWVYARSSNKQWATIIAKSMENQGPPYQVFSLQTTTALPSNLRWSLVWEPGGSNDRSYCVSASQLTAGNWTYITGTYNGTVMTLYFNGRPDNSFAVNKNLVTNSMSITIGSWFYDVVNQNFDGIIDEPRVYNKAVSPSFVGLSFENQRETNNIVIIEPLP
jgi:hypothetical protein